MQRQSLKMKLCIGLLIVLCLALTAKAQSGGSFNCPKDGLFKDPAHCDTFYNCANGIAYPQNCPTGLLFDASLKICNWPSSVQC